MRKTLIALVLGASAVALAGCVAATPVAYGPVVKRAEAKPKPVVRRTQPVRLAAAGASSSAGGGSSGGGSTGGDSGPGDPGPGDW